MLADIVRGDGSLARTVAAMTLGEIGTKASTAVPVLLGALTEPVANDESTAQFHIEAATAILLIAPAHPEATRAIEVLLRYSRVGATPMTPSCPTGGALRALRVLESYRRATGLGPPNTDQ